MTSSLWPRALNRVLITLAMVAAALIPSVVNAPAANAYTCPSWPGQWIRNLYNKTTGPFGADDDVNIILKCEASGALYAEGTIRTGNLPANHCFEVFHNVDLVDHRAPDMIRLCTPWTTKSFIYPIHNQNGSRAYVNQIQDLWLKTTALCVTAQWDFRRVDGWTCDRGTYDLREQPMLGVSQYYDFLDYATLLTNAGVPSMRLRGLTGIQIQSKWALDSPRNAARCVYLFRR